MSGSPAPPPPPEENIVKPEAAQVSLKVVSADGQETFFKIKRATKLAKLMDAYCKKQGTQRAQVRFLFDGKPLDDTKTPDDLQMDDDDAIDAVPEQIGGMRNALLL